MKKLFLLSILTIFFSCGGGSGQNKNSPTSPEISTEDSRTDTTQVDPLKKVLLVSPDNNPIKTRISSTAIEQTQGLQYVKDSEFSDEEGMLFFYLSEQSRTFWMPNTYFNLDLIYLDEDLTIIDIVWNLPHYTGSVNSEIPRAPTIKSRHVLEMKAGSPISSKLKIGDSLIWKSSLSLSDTEQRIRER